MKIKFNIPCIMHFDDYHEIEDFADRFNSMIGEKGKLKHNEIDADYGYDVIFYFNKQDAAYKALLKKHADILKGK